MGKFTKKKKGMAAISTASLPDIVFMLLFFFMLVTVLRSEDPLVEIKPPSASETTTIEQKNLVKYINVGPPIDRSERAKRGDAAVIQLNDSFATVSNIEDWVALVRDELSEADKMRMIVSLKVDRDTKMGIVTAVKQELREANALKILYATSQRKRTGSD
jgi:biopolymer transport protein ExbD